MERETLDSNQYCTAVVVPPITPVYALRIERRYVFRGIGATQSTFCAQLRLYFTVVMPGHRCCSTGVVEGPLLLYTEVYYNMDNAPDTE